MRVVEWLATFDELGARQRSARALAARRRRTLRSQKRDRFFVLGDCCGLIGNLLFEQRN